MYSSLTTEKRRWLFVIFVVTRALERKGLREGRRFRKYCQENTKRTPCFTGAYLQSLMNATTILPTRRDLKEISKDEIFDALDLERINVGPEKKNVAVSND